MITPTEYQDFVSATAIFAAGAGITYTTLGLMGESGEVAEKVKKMIRRAQAVDNEDLLSRLSEEQRQDLIKEVGDVLWYATAFLGQINSTLQEALDNNVTKLSSRRERNVLEGSGDNR